MQHHPQPPRKIEKMQKIQEQLIQGQFVTGLFVLGFAHSFVFFGGWGPCCAATRVHVVWQNLPQLSQSPCSAKQLDNERWWWWKMRMKADDERWWGKMMMQNDDEKWWWKMMLKDTCLLLRWTLRTFSVLFPYFFRTALHLQFEACLFLDTLSASSGYPDFVHFPYFSDTLGFPRIPGL